MAKLDSLKLFGAVRETAGKEWIDTDSLSPFEGVTKTDVDWMDKEIPKWAALNPVVRIASFTLTEEGDGG